MKVFLMKIYWFFKSELPEETPCEHCGRLSPYYYDECPFCYEDEPDIIEIKEKENGSS